MPIPFELIAEEDLELGYGVLSRTNPAGGVMAGNKIGIHTFIRGMINLEDKGADMTGVNDSTAAIEDAIDIAEAIGGLIYAPPGTMKTDGGHVLNTARILGADKNGTIFKRGSGTATIFSIVGKGSLENCTIDGNSLNGCGVTVGTLTVAQTLGALRNVLFQNCGAAVATKAITGATNANPCVITANNHGFADGDLISIKGATGLQATGNPDLTVINATYRISNVTLHTFRITDDTLLFSAYGGGGTAERASYALTVEKVTGGYAAYGKTFRDLEFRNNYGHIFIGNASNLSFDRALLYGHTPGWGIYFSNRGIDNIKFRDCYMENGVATQYWGIRDVTFDGLRVIFYAAQAWDRPWWYSIGFNSTYGSDGGEVAQIKFRDVSIYRQVNDTVNPLFDLNNYHIFFDNVHIYDYASGAGWSVIRDRTTFYMRLQDLVVESTNSWKLFHSASLGGVRTIIDGAYYTQGVVGLVTLPSVTEVGGSSGHTVVRNSNLNYEVAAGACRGFLFENITGDIDLTNAAAYGTILFNCLGTVTDPNAAISLSVFDGRVLVLNPYYSHADNAAAVGAGRAAGEVYMADGTGALQKGALMRTY